MKKTILFALPFAGGSAGSYAGWKKNFSNYEFIPLEYPGHGMRINERVYPKSIEILATDITRQIETMLLDRNENTKFAIFGHSLGAIVAYQTCIILSKEYNLRPEWMSVSACASPDLFPEKLFPEKEEEVLDLIIKEEMMNIEIANGDFFRRVILPIICADYKIINLYKYKNIDEKLENPLYVVYSKEDEFDTVDACRCWSKYGKGIVEYQEYKGGHFYFKDNAELVKLCKFLDQRENRREY